MKRHRRRFSVSCWAYHSTQSPLVPRGCSPMQMQNTVTMRCEFSKRSDSSKLAPTFITMSQQTTKQPQEIKSIPPHIKYLLIDCDGVLFLQSKLLHDSIPSMLNKLRTNHNMQMVFVTNNSTKSREEYKEKMRGMGMPWVEKEDIFVSGFLTSVWLQQKGYKSIYLIGEHGLRREIEEHGITVTKHPETFLSLSEKDVAAIPESELSQHECVVVGWDRSFTFAKCTYACICLQQKRDVPCQFVATNEDSYDKVDHLKNIPGSGAMVASIEKGSQREATVIGKPNTFAIELLEKTRGWTRENMLMIGDRLDSDILMANRGGVESLLVFSGTTDQKMLHEHISMEEGIVPTYVIEDLSKLVVE